MCLDGNKAFLKEGEHAQLVGWACPPSFRKAVLASLRKLARSPHFEFAGFCPNLI